MHRRVQIGILVISAAVTSCCCIGISSKLDFGEEGSSLPSFVQSSHYRKVPDYKKEQGKTNTEGFDGIGVVCVAGGCNATAIKNTSEDKGIVKTDVVVHVQTTVSLDKNKTVVDDTPDVPVVIGTGNTEPTFGNAPSYFAPSNPEVAPSYGMGRSFDSNTNIEDGNLYFGEEPRIETLPPIVVSMSNDARDVRYKVNGIQVPYFEPTFNTHFFGEQPPQPVWYPRRVPETSSSYSPMDFKGTPKAIWTPSAKPWMQPNTPPPYHKHSTTTTHCDCRNYQTGPQWQPRRAFNQDPGSQINDKLAPLN